MSAHAITVMRNDLAPLVRRHVQTVLKHLPRARRGDVGALHQARVASRRLREALPVMAAAAGGELHRGLARDVKRVTRALGAVREMDVALQEFEKDADLRRWATVPVDRVRRHLTSERARRERAMQAKLAGVSLKRFEQRILGLAKRAETGSPRPWESVLIARLRRRAKWLAEALHATGTMYAPDLIHQVRIAGKKLRYALELAHGAAGAPVGREIAALKRLQDLLGRLRDLQILQAHVRFVASEAADDVALTAALDAMQTELEAECRTLHADFLRGIESTRRARRSLRSGDSCGAGGDANHANGEGRAVFRVKVGTGAASLGLISTSGAGGRCKGERWRHERPTSSTSCGTRLRPNGEMPGQTTTSAR